MVSAPVPASRLLIEVFVSWGLPCTPQGHLPWTLLRGSLETLLPGGSHRKLTHPHAGLQGQGYKDPLEIQSRDQERAGMAVA